MPVVYTRAHTVKIKKYTKKKKTHKRGVGVRGDYIQLNILGEEVPSWGGGPSSVYSRPGRSARRWPWRQLLDYTVRVFVCGLRP